MSIGLKKVSATYQRAMQHIFDDMLPEEADDYVDDIIVKTKMRKDDLSTLLKVVKKCRSYNLGLNPGKCAFDVTSGQFIGFSVHDNTRGSSER